MAAFAINRKLSVVAQKIFIVLLLQSILMLRVILLMAVSTSASETWGHRIALEWLVAVRYITKTVNQIKLPPDPFNFLGKLLNCACVIPVNSILKKSNNLRKLAWL